MNRIDGSDHYEVSATGQTPSLLTLIIDTNPRAWHALADTLPISKAIANILVFVNAHLAFGNDNQVAILAAHSHRAVWLYPQPPPPPKRRGASRARHHGDDVEMTGTATNGDGPAHHHHEKPTAGSGSANKYPQFASIESTILESLRSLIEATPTTDLPHTTLVAGALTTALAHINKTAQAFAPPKPASDAANPSTAAANALANAPDHPTLHARILVLSVSDSEPAQYIATMNAVFAAAHARIPIDTLSLSPYASPTFLQQAAFITGGSYLSAATPPSPPVPTSSHTTAATAPASTTTPAAQAGPPDLTRVRGLLTYLFFALLPDAAAREHLVRPTQHGIDFRAACFCHRRVVDTGFVCSVCLSIFCAAPPDAECLTCGTKLALGHYGARPQLVPRRKKKKAKKAASAAAVGAAAAGSREATGSATGTPGP